VGGREPQKSRDFSFYCRCESRGEKEDEERCVCNDVTPSRRVQLARRPCSHREGAVKGRMRAPGSDWLSNVLATVIFGRPDSFNSLSNTALVVATHYSGLPQRDVPGDMMS
jgi:hypothetical protein